MPVKSRLNPEVKKTLLKKQAEQAVVSSHHQTQNNSRTITKYLKHLPLLILSAPFYFLINYILQNIYPQDIANIPVYNSYLGLLIPFFLANMFLFSYVFLNSRRGANLSFLLTLLLFLKLQHFIFEYWWFVPIVIVFVINEKLSKKTEFKKRTRD